MGYAVWQSKEKEPLAHVLKERQEADMKMAERYIHEGEPKRALPLIHQYKEEMEKDSVEGRKWLSLFVDATTELRDSDQLMMIYQFNKDVFKNNEKSALSLADALIKSANQMEFENVRKLWKNREKNLPAWTLLDADALLQQGQKAHAYEMLKDKKWTGELENERLMRIALIKLRENPQEALDIFNAEYVQNPKNSEILLFRGNIYESQNKIPLAEQDFIAAAHLNPRDIYLQDQLAEFYRRQKNYTKALVIWQKLLSQEPNDQIWLKSLFWSRVSAPPSSYDWKNVQLPDMKSKPFLSYVTNLKPGHYWDVENFEKIPNHLDALIDYQATYWLRLLEALKTHDEREALALLNNNQFEGSSWAPLLEISLRRILNYRQNGTLLYEKNHAAEPQLSQLPNQDNIPPLYKELDLLAQQELIHGSSFSLPENIQALLNNQEIFPVAFFSEGWVEAALQLHPLSVLSSEFPEWVPELFVNGLRQNRGNHEALKFALEQKRSPIILLLTAEIQISEGKIDEAIPALEKLQSYSNDIGAKAAWFISLIDIQRGLYAQAEEVINAHPQLAQSLEGQEVLGRIAVMKGEFTQAAQIYEKIINQSKEAKSFLARQAYQQKNWTLARKLTENLLHEFPGNLQLQQNLKKIISQENQEKKPS